MSSNELSAQISGPRAVPRNSTTRDELFAGLCILACANGLWGRVLMAARDAGWSGAVFSLDISAIVLLACVGAVWLMLRDKSGEIRAADLGVTLVLVIFIILPIFALSWVALTGLGLYILLFASGSASRKRGAVLMLAITVPMLWVPLLIQFFERPILEFDASLVARLIGSHQIGNMVAFNQGIRICPNSPRLLFDHKLGPCILVLGWRDAVGRPPVVARGYLVGLSCLLLGRSNKRYAHSARGAQSRILQFFPRPILGCDQHNRQHIDNGRRGWIQRVRGKA